MYQNKYLKINLKKKKTKQDIGPGQILYIEIFLNLIKVQKPPAGPSTVFIHGHKKS